MGIGPQGVQSKSPYRYETKNGGVFYASPEMQKILGDYVCEHIPEWQGENVKTTLIFSHEDYQIFENWPSLSEAEQISTVDKFLARYEGSGRFDAIKASEDKLLLGKEKFEYYEAVKEIGQVFPQSDIPRSEARDIEMGTALSMSSKDFSVLAGFKSDTNHTLEWNQRSAVVGLFLHEFIHGKHTLADFIPEPFFEPQLFKRLEGEVFADEGALQIYKDAIQNDSGLDINFPQKFLDARGIGSVLSDSEMPLEEIIWNAHGTDLFLDVDQNQNVVRNEFNVTASATAENTLTANAALYLNAYWVLADVMDNENKTDTPLEKAKIGRAIADNNQNLHYAAVKFLLDKGYVTPSKNASTETPTNNDIAYEIARNFVELYEKYVPNIEDGPAVQEFIEKTKSLKYQSNDLNDILNEVGRRDLEGNFSETSQNLYNALNKTFGLGN